MSRAYARRSPGRPRLCRSGLIGLSAIALTAAGCATATNELHPSQEELKVASKGALGQVIVDDEGHTMYLFEKDGAGESYCSGACESVWPPVTTKGMPKVEDGLDPSKVTLLKRENGLQQVVYNVHPLYYYQADTSSDDTYGQAKNQFGAEWYVVNRTGSKVESSGNQGGEGNGY